MKNHETHGTKINKKFSYDVSSELPANGNYKVIIESKRQKGDEITVESMSLYRY